MKQQSTKPMLVVGGPHSGKRYALLYGKRLRIPLPVDPVKTTPGYASEDDISKGAHRLSWHDYEVMSFYMMNYQGKEVENKFLVPLGQSSEQTIFLLAQGYEESHK